MYHSMNCEETIGCYKKQGVICGWVSSFLLIEYSQSKKESFAYECFTGSLRDLSEADKKGAFRIAASCGHYLIPIAEKTSGDFGMRRERKTFLAWMPEAFLATIGTYLENFERLVKASYDYLQEADEVVQFANDLAMLRGDFDQFENNRKRLYAAIAGLETKESKDLLAAHFRGDTKEDFLRLVRVMERLDSRWSESCPHWETWQHAVNWDWHVAFDTESPLRNFETFVENVKQRDVIAEPWFGL